MPYQRRLSMRERLRIRLEETRAMRVSAYDAIELEFNPTPWWRAPPNFEHLAEYLKNRTLALPTVLTKDETAFAEEHERLHKLVWDGANAKENT